MIVGIALTALTAAMLPVLSSGETLDMPLSATFEGAASAAGTAPAATQQVIPSVHLALVTPDSLHLVWRFQVQREWYLYAPYRNDTASSGLP